MMDIRNPNYTADGAINCEIDHPQFGWIPCTATADDPDTAETFAQAQAMTPAPYVPPAPPAAEDLRGGISLTRTQFCVAIRKAGIVSRTEAVAAAKGDWPASLLGVLAALSDDDKADAMIAWAAATQINRLNPLILSVQAGLAMTDAQVDALFGGLAA